VRDGRWPPLTANARAIAVSTSGHLLYGVLLGVLAGVNRRRVDRTARWPVPRST
jgi:hypothetical protein